MTIATEWDTLAAASDIEDQRVMLRRALGQHQLIIDRVAIHRPDSTLHTYLLHKPDRADHWHEQGA